MSELEPNNGSSNGSGGQRRPLQPARTSTDTAYNSVNGKRRMIRVGNVHIPCNCGISIIGGERVLYQCGCKFSLDDLRDIEFGDSSLDPPQHDDMAVDDGIDPGPLAQESDPHGPGRSSRAQGTGDKSSYRKRATGSKSDAMGGAAVSDTTAGEGTGEIPRRRVVPAADSSDEESRGERLPANESTVRIQPGRSAKQVPFSKESYHLTDRSSHTGMCYIDVESAFEMGALKDPAGDGNGTKELCALINELINSKEAVKQIKALFKPADLRAKGSTRFGRSSHAGESCAGGLFATRKFEPGDVVSCYGGFGIDIREHPNDEEKVPSDRKIVLDIFITKPCGEVVPCQSMFIGWEKSEISDRFPLVRGHIINHSCISNCEMKMVPLTFERDGFKYEINIPIFCVAMDVKDGVEVDQEFTCDYGREMCYFSPFFENEHQDAIIKAQSCDNLRERKKILKDVPRTIPPGVLRAFLDGCAGTACGCAECNHASTQFDPPFDPSMMNLGPNDMDTTQLRREINYDAVPAPRAASVTDAKSRARTSSSRTGSRSEGTSGRDNDSSEAVSKSTRSSSSSLSGARTKQSGSAQVGDGGSQAGDGGSGDGGSRDGSTSRAAGATHAQRGKSGMRVSASGSRPGYTRDSRIKYMPYALAVFSSPDKSYNENREAWVSERTAHDRAQSKPLSWSDTARLLLVTGGAPPVDAAAKANEFLHPAPPIPDDT